MNARLFEELRPVGFAVAYRMLGSVSEAEDIVQEAFLRIHHMLADGGRIESPRAYLSTVVTRLCIDHLRSARVRRETYVDALPEPLVGEPGAAVPLVPASGAHGAAGDDPASHAEVADSLSLAFLVLLESLSPEQRAAFLLREVFDYPYDQIAAIVATSEDNARQLVVRARRHVEQRRPRFEPSRERREGLARRFFAAAQDGDLGALEELLAHDVTLHGGGLAQPITGRVRVARTLMAGMRVATARIGDISVREVSVNGQPGAMVLDPSERLIGVLALDIAVAGRIQTVTSVIDADKLRHLGPLADLAPLGGRGRHGGGGGGARGPAGPLA
ncbi:MAG TPA: sigma-70 family RNA polymerase sigma factor [Euzebyales bacterium]|nr:sigma-70 family RNA polymerase sigma factor [Euzebyales bacterium]